MGVWMIGTGNIKITPRVNEELIREYIEFSNSSFPEAYRDEIFFNTWCFDQDNNLFSIEGKFAEPSIWYAHIKENFFEPRGYELEGEMILLDECEAGYEEACQMSREKYQEWKEREEKYDIYNRRLP